MERKQPILIALLTGILLSCFSIRSFAELTLPLENMATSARLYYVSPTGAGDQSGSNADNALPWLRLRSFVAGLTSSSRIQMLPGTYAVTEAVDIRSPSDSTVLVLEGSTDAVIKGTFNFTATTGTGSGLRLRGGNVILRNLSFENTGYCVKPEKSISVNQVLIENLKARDVHSCILVDRDSQKPMTRWIVRNADIKGYYRTAIRLAGTQSKDFLLEGLKIDGAHTQGASDCFKAGIQLYAGVSQVHIRNSSITNNIGSCGEAYQQGDGIEADHKEGTPNQILMENVEVSNSGDADLDLKANNVTLYRVVSLGGELTRYAFKTWTYDNYKCNECYAYGVHKAYINLLESTMTFNGSTFASDDSVHLCDLRHGTTPEEQAVARFNDSSMFVGNDEWLNECGPGALDGIKRLSQGRQAPPRPANNLQGN